METIEMNDVDEVSVNTEDNSYDSTSGIVIKSLCKSFRKGNILRFEILKAVDNLSLEIKRGEIFSLLGVNGAGKSTTINVICGALGLDKGEVKIDGYSIENDMNMIRERIGVCPQDDVVFEDLTANDHLKLIGAIKNVDRKQLNEEIVMRLNQVNLLKERYKPVKNFSGGMKRRLSLALALIGNPDILILDEPTSGLDPFNKHCVWKILEEYKKNKIVLLTTHSMEEADLLSDTIAILKRGKLEVIGSSLTLKNHYGVGYILTCFKNNSTQNLESDHDFKDKVLSIVKSHIEDVEIKESRVNETKMILPYSSSSKFGSLLRDIEKEKDVISDYSLSITTLEQIFLKINEDVINEN